jgi:hypothetical protein
MNSAVINPNNAIPSIHTPRPKLFTAKRFVDTKNLTHAEWLEVRRKGSAVVIVPQPVVSTRICRCLNSG